MKTPYYVYAPRYVATSAGIRALYRLVDAINAQGGEAWIITMPYLPTAYVVPDDLDAPLLTREALARHRREGHAPIVVYPETVTGNPLHGSCVVRYVMNEPGLLGGSSRFDGEIVYGYGQRLSASLGAPDQTLFVPVIDTRRFTPGDAPRDLILYYAAKYKAVHNGEIFGVPDGAVEITRDEANSPRSEDLEALLRRARRIYIFENSALAIEAPLCGCAAVMMPNPYLSYPIGDLDHGMDGIAWGDSPEEVARAEATVAGMRPGYEATYRRFETDLARFIAHTQAEGAKPRPFGVPDSALAEPSYFQLAAEAAVRMARTGQGLALPRKALAVARRHGISGVLKTLAAWTRLGPRP